jgi:hypothetical protein
MRAAARARASRPLRSNIVAVPARIARPQRRPVIHLIARWPWADAWTRLWQTVFPTAASPPALA